MTEHPPAGGARPPDNRLPTSDAVLHGVRCPGAPPGPPAPRIVNDPAMSEPAALLVRALADGRSRDRAELARECGVDAASLDEALERLSRLGVAPVAGSGTVALPRPVDLLDAGRILRAAPRLRPEAIHLRFAVDSTNTVLAERLRAGAAAPELCAAEIQTAGRGRRGRRWIGGLGQSVMLSVSWRFTPRSDALSGLSLAVGAALAEALAAGGFGSVMLKWPNDLIAGDRKLAGILVEASHARPGAAACVIGVGFNLDLAPADSVRSTRHGPISHGSSAGFRDEAGWSRRRPTRSSTPASSTGTTAWNPSRPAGASGTRYAAGPCACCRGERRSRGGRAGSTATVRCSSSIAPALRVAVRARSRCGRSMPEQDGDASRRSRLGGWLEGRGLPGRVVRRTPGFGRIPAGPVMSDAAVRGRHVAFAFLLRVAWRGRDVRRRRSGGAGNGPHVAAPGRRPPLTPRPRPFFFAVSPVGPPSPCGFRSPLSGKNGLSPSWSRPFQPLREI